MTLSEYQKKKYGSKGVNGKEEQKTESEPSSFAEARYRVLVHDYDEYGKAVNSFGDNYRSSDSFSTMSQRLNALEERRTSLDNYFTKNKYYDKNKTLYESMTALRTFGQNARDFENNSQKFWSQFANEEAYNYAVKRSKRQSELSAMSDDELESEIKRLSDSRDRAKKQSGGKFINTVGRLFVDDPKYRSAYSSNISAIEDYDREIDLVKREKASRVFKTIDELPESVRALLDEYSKTERQQEITGISDFFTGMTDKGYYDTAHQLDSASKAQRLAEIKDELTSLGYDADRLTAYARFQYDEEEAGNDRAYYAEMANEHPVMSSINTVLLSPMKFVGIAGALKDAAGNDELPANPNSPYYFLNDYTNTTRDTVMENTNWNGKYTNIDWFDQLYSTVMSTGDSLMAGLIGAGVPGVGSAVGGTIIGASAMADTAQKVAQNGGSKEQALLTGLFAGINESLWETVSLGQFKALSEKGISNLLSKDGIKTAITNLLKSAGVNASEEFNTEVANIFIDYALNGNMSDYEQAYEAALAQGMSEDEARKSAALAMTKQALEAGFGGALQGLLMGGGATTGAMFNSGITQTSNLVGDIVRGRQLKADGTFSSVQEQIGNLGNEKLQAKADKAAQKMAEGKRVSARKLGAIQRKAYIQSSKQASQAATDAISEQLREYGDENAEDTAEILRQAFLGRDADLESLEDNEAAQRVMSEYFSEDGAEWVSDLDERLKAARNVSYRIASGTQEDLLEEDEQLGADAARDFLAASEGVAPADAFMSADRQVAALNAAYAENLKKADAEMFDTENLEIDDENGAEDFAVGVDGNGEISSLYIDGEETPIAEVKLTQRDAELVAGLSFMTRELGLDFVDANAVLGEFYKSGLGAKDYIRAARVVVSAAQIGNASVLSNSKMAQKLPQAVRERLYKTISEGKTGEAATKQSIVDKARGKKKGKTSAVTYVNADGEKIDVADFSDAAALKQIFTGVSDEKISQIMFLSDVASALGTDITFTNTRGGKKLYNAFYDSGRNSFTINIDAGRVGEEYMTFSASHELTHFIKVWSPAKYKAFADFLVQTYSEKGVDIEILIKRKIELSQRVHDAEVAQLGAAHPEWSDAEIEAACETYVFTRDQAFDEVVADSCESFLLDGNIAEKLKELQQQDMSLFDKVCKWLSDFIDNLKKVRDIIKSGNYSAQSLEANMVKTKFGEQADELIARWEDALADAREASVSTDGVFGMGVAEQFSLSSDVEETRDLLAVHNLTAEKLLSTLRLGGFPMPSIAVIKAKMGFSNFGDISLIFDKEAINPKSKRNKVYSGDAYTPVFPHIGYKASERVRSKIYEAFSDLRGKYGRDRVNALYGLAEYPSDELNRYGGEAAIIKRLLTDNGLREVFLLEKGVILPEIEEHTETTLKPYMHDDEAKSSEYFKLFAKKLGADFVEQFKSVSRSEFLGLFDKNIETIKKAQREAEAALYDNPSDMDETALAVEFANLRNFLMTGGKKTVTVKDGSKRDAFVRENAEKYGYSDWVTGLVGGLEEKRGIRNNKDFYTASGSRRSFEALHYEFTLENIVRAMLEGTQKGKGVGGYNLFASSTREYKSIEDIRADRGRLQEISEEEYDALREQYSARLREITDRFARDKNDWQNYDAASDLLLEALTVNKTKSAVAAYLKREGAGWTDYSDSIVDDLIELAAEVAQMPVTYFEAKPQRAVDFSEVAMAVIPDSSSDELRAALTDAGIAFEEYAAANEDSRTAVMNKQTGVMFQYDIENGPNKKFAKALTSDEWEKYNYAMISGVDAGLRISENAMLVECEKGEYSYKLVVYDSTFEDAPIKAVYGIGNDSYSDMTIHEVAQLISDLEESGYDQRRIISKTLKSIAKMRGIVLGAYNGKSGRYYRFGGNNSGIGQNSANQSDRAGVFGSDKGTVKKEFQLTEDSEGSELSEAQAEYFRDSKVRNKDGRLLVMYRGGSKNAFTVFDRKKSKPSNLYGTGFYFTSSKAHAEQYGNARAFYLDIKNPVTPGTRNITKAQMRRFIAAVAEDEDYGLDNYGERASVESVLKSVWGKDDYLMLWDINSTVIGDFVNVIEWFNEINGTNFDGIIVPTETVTFRSNQAKLVTNRTPTGNADIRYQLTEEDSEYLALAEHPEANETRLREMVDAAAKSFGYDIRAFHGTGADFTSFDRGKIGTNYNKYLEFGAGFYFTPNEKEARRWAENGEKIHGNKVMSVFLSADRLLNADEPLNSARARETLKLLGLAEPDINFTLMHGYRFINQLFASGYSNIEVQEELMSFGYDGIDASFGKTNKTGQYVVFDPSQVKSADLVTYDDNGDIIPLSRRFDSRSSDIRYQYSGFDDFGMLEGEYEDDEFDSEALDRFAEDYTRLESLRALVKATKPKKSSVMAAANIICKKYGISSTAAKTELVTRLESYYESINSGASAADVFKTSQDIAAWLYNQRKSLPLDEYAQTILSDLRTRRVSLSAEQKAEVAGTDWDSFGEYRKSLMGSIIISNDGQSMEDLFSDLSNLYPNYFDAAENPIDMPSRLAEIISDLRSSYAAEDTDSAIKYLATDIYDSYWNITAFGELGGTVAKKAEAATAVAQQETQSAQQEAKTAQQEAAALRKEIASLRTEHDKAIEKMQKAYDKRIEGVKQRYQKARTRIRENAKEREAKKTQMAKLQKSVAKTIKWLSAPAKGETPCPDILKNPYLRFLQVLNMASRTLTNKGQYTKQDIKNITSLAELADTIDKILKSQSTNAVDNTTEAALTSDYLDLPADYVERLRASIDGILMYMGYKEDSRPVRTLISEEIKELNYAITALNSAIKRLGKLYNNMRFANAKALGKASTSFLDGIKSKFRDSLLGNFLRWDNAVPFYAFKRFGEAGSSIFTEFMDAQDKLAFLSNEIFKFKDKTWTDAESKKWGSDTHTIQLSEGKNVTVTTADVMSIYCLAKRQQAVGHLLGGGIRVIGVEKNGRKAEDSRTTLTEEDVRTIVDTLTDRQRAVADAIQKYMSTVCAQWGNEISYARWMTNMFTEEFYFPIESNDENLQARDPKANQSDLFRLLNISATKPLTKGANNEVVIRNIFEIFVNHASDMAKLNSFGLPLLDAMKWINYRDKATLPDGRIETNGTRKALERAYGHAAFKYILNFIKDINSNAADLRENSFAMKAIRASKTAAVAANFRVAILQMTALPRARLVLPASSIAKGLLHKPQIAKSKQYCGIALWKSFGFYDTNINRSIESQLLGEQTAKERIIEITLKGAEFGDSLTWGYLWNACEIEVQKDKTLVKGTPEYYEAVGKKLREVVYQTQVVDSTLTRSQIMRSKSGLNQMITGFMSEPTLSYNILLDAYSECKLKGWNTAKGYVCKAIGTYMISALAAALVEGFADALRDDDDDKDLLEKFLSHTWENGIQDLLVVGKIPVFKDIESLVLSVFGIGYFSSDRMDTAYLTAIKDAYDDWAKIINKGLDGSSVSLYKAIYDTMTAVSKVSGLPFSNATREVVTIWNDTAGAAEPSLKIRKYGLGGEDSRKLLYKSILEGDTKTVEQIKSEFKTEKSYKNSVRTALRENDGRIVTAVVRKLRGEFDEYVVGAEEIKDEGFFTQDDVISSIRSEKSWFDGKIKEAKELEDYGRSNDKIVKELVERGYPEDLVRDKIKNYVYEEESEEKHKSYFEKDDIKLAITTKPTYLTLIKNDLIRTNKANGKTEDEAKSAATNSVVSALEDVVKASKITDSAAENILKQYCDYTADKAESKVRFWKFRAQNDFELSETAYNSYLDYGQPAGIALADYYGYQKATGKMKGDDADGDGKTDSGSLKKKICAYIDSMPITNAQKDALYYANGWKESRIYEAPWH